MRALTLLLLLCVGTAEAQLRLGGIAELATAVQITDGRGQKAELSLLPSLEWRGAVDITAIARLRADAWDRLEPGRPEQAAIAPGSRRALERQAEAELRELYAELDWGDNYLRLGKQQIVWGQADGLKVLDRVNPQSFREFILADFSESRIPLWSLKLERPLSEGFDLQLIFIPDQTYHELPGPDSIFAITSPGLVPASSQQTISEHTTQRPQRRWADADSGLQLSTRLAGWDLSLNALYHYADTPVVTLSQGAGGIRAQSRYVRTRTFGGSAANAIGDFTLRAELGYSTHQPFPHASPSPPRASLTTGELSYVFGLDWMGLQDTLISGQVFQSRIHAAAAARDAVETDLSLLIERSWLHQVLRLRLLAIHDLDQGDGLLSPTLSYQWRSDIELELETDLFYGASSGRFGQFDDKDRLVFKTTIGF